MLEEFVGKKERSENTLGPHYQGGYLRMEA
jgi:hypothetical protein